MNRVAIWAGALLATNHAFAAIFSAPIQESATAVPAVSEISLAAMAVVVGLAAWRILRRR